MGWTGEKSKPEVVDEGVEKTGDMNLDMGFGDVLMDTVFGKE